MEERNSEEVVKDITRIILKSNQKMIREEDIKTICKGFDYDNIISSVYQNLKNAGFELITTQFLNQKYFVLTSDGKDDSITPSQYGSLALVLALSKELDENLKLEDLKEIFKEVWAEDIEFLINNDYLRKIKVDDIEIIKITPLGKAVMKNIIRDLQLKSLLDVFNLEKE